MPERSNSPARLEDLPDELPADEVVIVEGAQAGGAFADVHRATYNGQPVAIKALRRMKDVEPVSMNRKVERGSRPWQYLDHENVLQLLGFVNKPHLSPYRALVSPWCEHGSLTDYMEKNPNMTMHLRIKLLHGVTKGLEYLHSGKTVIVHGDLKPLNILLDSNLSPKLCDIGLVRVIHEGPSTGLTTTSNYLGSTRYLAPELLSEFYDNSWRAFWEPRTNAQVIVRPTTASDVHALGSIGLEIMTSITPYDYVVGDGLNAHLKLLNEIKSGNPPARRPSELSNVMKLMWRDVFEAAWRKKAKKRPTAGELCILIERYRSDPIFQESQNDQFGHNTSAISSPSGAPIVSDLSIDFIPNLSGKVVLIETLPVFQGSYSNVYRGRCDEKDVAIKVLKIEGDNQEAIKQRHVREATTWYHLAHRYILPLLGVINSGQYGPWPALVSPWCHNGDAAEYIGHVDIHARVKLFYQIALAVQYLHSLTPPLAHGDLKPYNIFVDENGDAQLGDFGDIRLIHNDPPTALKTTTAHMGTMRYLSYELVANEHGGLPTTSSDVHALACTGMEFIYRQPPYAYIAENALNVVPLAISQKIPPARRPIIYRSDSEKGLWNLLEACWDTEPQNRPPAFQICSYLSLNLAELVKFDYSAEETHSIISNTISSLLQPQEAPDDGSSIRSQTASVTADDDQSIMNLEEYRHRLSEMNGRELQYLLNSASQLGLDNAALYSVIGGMGSISSLASSYRTARASLSRRSSSSTICDNTLDI